MEEFFYGLEGVSVVFVGVKPFFDFAVGLRVFDASKYLLDVMCIKPVAKATVAACIVGELASVVADALFDVAILQC